MRSLVRELFIILYVLFSASVYAVDDIGEFEMDGNAIEGVLPPPPFDQSVEGDDWDTLASGGGNPMEFTGIIHDHDPDNIFEGGKKDIQDITEWTWKTGTPLDKGNIQHAYAAAYRCPTGGVPGECNEGDIVAYFGADRLSNKGDAFMGFWFFKQNVETYVDEKGNGRFSGFHVNGDTLVLVNFPQATNASPVIKAVKWNDACNSGSKDALPGECAAKNLELVYNGVVCHSVSSDLACAITNTQDLYPNTVSPMSAGTVQAPWDYISKTPDPNCIWPYCFPYETFFEGGINLTQLVALGGDTCFASFMAETRSSSEFTATLKDFSLDEFPLCAVELSKVCETGVYNPASGYLEIPYSITVENTGGANVDTIVASDDVCGTVEAENLQDFTFNNLLTGTSQTQSGTCQILPGLINPPIENGVTAIADGGETAVVLAESCTTKDGSPGWCFDGCNFNLSPDIGISKQCDTRLVAEDGEVKVKVVFDGVVTNTSDVNPAPITDVEVWDDNGTPSDTSDDVQLTLTTMGGTPLPTPVTLEPGASAYFNGDYRPSILNAECPSAAEFTNVVTATAVDVFTGAQVEDFAPATCTLCEEGNCD